MFAYTGSASNWRLIGGPVDEIFYCGDALCAAASNTGRLSWYDDGTWVDLGPRGRAFASTPTALYKLSADGREVLAFGGAPDRWRRIGGAAGHIYANDQDLFATDPHSGDILRYTGSGWTHIGAPGRTFVGVGSTLVGLSMDGSSVYQWSRSSDWRRVGGAAGWVHGGRDLHATNPSTGDIWRFDDGAWTNLGQP